MSNSSPSSPLCDEQHSPAAVSLLQTQGWFLLGPVLLPSQSFPSASSWEFSFFSSCAGTAVPWSSYLLSWLILCFVGAYPPVVSGERA